MPIGPIAAISPFNFPMTLAAHKLAPAIAAGNSIVLKPATKTPLSALTLARLLDEAGTPIGLQTTQCGRSEQGIPAAVQAYCDVYGENLLDGWGRRRSEWQIGLGIQHELLPRFSAEVTYNRRSYSNLTVTDQLAIGCDRFNGALDSQACQQGFLDFNSPNYGFFNAVAPTHPDLPGGGGYVLRGLANPNTALPISPGSAVTIMDELAYSWNGVDTNFVWRGTDKWGLRGLRVNGGSAGQASELCAKLKLAGENCFVAR